MDEIALVVNVLERGWSTLLFQPLSHAQIGPVGFLFLEKASVLLAGSGELAFRVLPYVMSLAGLILFWRVARRFLTTPAMLAALTVFAVSPTLILYAGTAKQYSGDVAITLFLLLMTLRFLDRPPSLAGAAGLGIAGAAALLLSYPAVLIAFGLGTLLLVEGCRGRTRMLPLLVVLAGWFVGAAVSSWVSLSTLSPETGEYMQSGWKGGWVSAGPEALLWIPIRLGTILTYSAIGIHPPLESWPRIGIAALCSLLPPLGFARLFRIDRRTALVLAIPLIIALGALLVRLLPLAGRVSLFLAPVLLVGFFAGLDEIRAWVPSGLRGKSHAVLLGLATLPAIVGLALQPPPITQGGTRIVLEDVGARWRPGDRLIVARGRWTFRLVDYYAARLGIDEWTPMDRLEGAHRPEVVLRSYLRRIDAYRGMPRIWFHLEGTTPCEEEAILGYLEAIGERRHSIAAHLEWGHRISGYLYDLSRPAGLRSATAGGYPLPDCPLATGLADVTSDAGKLQGSRSK